MRVAAHEARRGHGKLAGELRTLLIHDRPPVREADIWTMLKERRTIADKLAARQT